MRHMSRTFPSEIRTFADRLTGRTIRQFTNYKGHSHHLYFTNPGWFDGGRRLLFGSDRGGRTNLFSVHLESGQIVQHTDADMPPPPHQTSFLSASVNPRRDEAYFWRGHDLMAIDLGTDVERLLHRGDEGFHSSMTNVTADGRFVCTCMYEDLSARFAVDLLNGYVGFREYHEARPSSFILAVPVDGGPARKVHQENYWIGHINTSPTLPNILTFCHEGPWGDVDNRIWGLDIDTGRAWMIRPRREPREQVGHEYWHADGIHVGFHGKSPTRGGLFGRIRYDNTNLLEATCDQQTGHIHSNDFSLIVGDGHAAPQRKPLLRLWRWAPSTFDGPRILCEHHSSEHSQQQHVHPRFSPDGRTIIFTSDRSGYGQVYQVEVGAFEDLPGLT
jgi:oligogalacturonide lyase